MLYLLSALAEAACPSTSEDVVLSIEKAEGAFRDLDVVLFRRETDGLTLEVGCLHEHLPREVIARIHRVEGLRAFVDGDTDRAVGAFASARVIEPSYRFPETLVPVDHPVQGQYLAGDPGLVPRVALLPPAEGRLEIDGRVEPGLPEDRPAVVQWIRDDGSVPESVYHWPGGPVFAYPGAPIGAPGDAPPLLMTSSRRTSRTIAVVAGAVLATAGGLYTGAAISRGQYFADDATTGDLDPLRAQTNSLFWGAVGVGAVGLGLGGVAVVAHRW